MPFAVALLCHPLGAYALSRRGDRGRVRLRVRTRGSFVPAFTAASAALLTTLAFLQVPPTASAWLLLALGVALLHAEFLLADVRRRRSCSGSRRASSGSWQLLAAAPGASGTLAPALRVALAVTGTLTLLAAVLRGCAAAHVRPP